MKIRNKLYEAVGEGDVESLRELLDISNQKEHYGELLSIAVTHNFLEIVTLLLEHQANPNIQDNRGNTPILYTKFDTMFRLLLEHNADIDLQNKAGDSIRSILEDPTLSKYNSHLSKLLNDYLIEQLQNIKVADEGVVVTELGSVNICE